MLRRRGKRKRILISQRECKERQGRLSHFLFGAEIVEVVANPLAGHRPSSSEEPVVQYQI
jgi:hypothetical protein